ncbi:MAG: membrane protein insertase YidC, partial [Pseudomonadota bacterium]|nr:membrane protein insertase YidC [Pseudomonadota bacterium]
VRLLLISTTAVLSLMLLIEWNRYSDEYQKQQSELYTAAITEPSVLTNKSVAAPISQGINDDIPSVNQETNPLSVLLDDSETFKLSTDSLDLVVSADGGDVVSASLPRFPVRLDTPDQPFRLLENNNLRRYVAQSGLIGPDGIDASGNRARYASQGVNNNGDGSHTLTLAWTGNDPLGMQVYKRFTAHDDRYDVDVSFDIRNDGSSVASVTSFAQLKRDNTQAPDGNTGFGVSPYLGAALTQPDERYTKLSFSDLKDEPFSKRLPAGWVAILQHYFVSAWIPSQQTSHDYFASQLSNGDNVIGYKNQNVDIAPGSAATITQTLYVGPKDQVALAELAENLDLVIDYGWLWWLAQPLFWLLTLIQQFVINWGLAIIALTIVIKLIFFRLSAASYKSMAKMRTVQPKIQSIRDQYADDKTKQQQAMMELWKKEKINPMGGCLPMLIQMPVFIALYWVLLESVELRHAPFILWIEDLSAMDPYFVLPILMGISMWLMQRLNPAPPDPMQAKIMMYMPIAFTFLMMWFPAGLVLYWLCNNLLSFAQQYVVTRQIEQAAAR